MENTIPQQEKNCIQLFLGRLLEQKWLLAVVLVSFAVRLVIWGWVVDNSAQPLADEAAYFRRAVAFAQVLRDVEAGNPVSVVTDYQAYGEGRWPPLFPMSLGAVIYISGFQDVDAQLAIARLVNVVLSALSTGLVYLLGRSFFDHKVAIAGAVIHIVSLEAIAYSHRLMSEVPYGFLILIMMYALVSFWKSESIRARLGWIFVIGIALGLAGLVRASILTFLVIIPFAVLWYKTSSFRLVYAVCVGLITVSVITPWLLTLYEREGKFVLFATSGGTNIGSFNNMFFDVNYIYHDEPRVLKEQADDYLEAYARDHEILKSDAGFAIGVDTIVHEPILTARRVIDRMLHHISYDYDLMVMFMRLGYPPMSSTMVLFANVILLLSHIVIVFLIFVGVINSWHSFEYRYLWLLLAVSTMLLSATSVSVPRFHHVTLLLYLPFAGYALSKKSLLSKSNIKPPVVLGGLAVVTFASAMLFLPGIRSQRPTSYYRELVNDIDGMLGTTTRIIDEISFQTTTPDDFASVEIKIMSEGYQFEDGGQVFVWYPNEKPIITTVVIGYSPVESLEVEITVARDDEQSVQTITPIQEQSWRSWIPLGETNIEYQWNSDA